MKKIDLHLPTGWNQCTVEELEHIAASILAEQALVSRYRIFDWDRVKVSIVLAINDITIMPSDDDATVSTDSVRGEEWLVKRPQDAEPWPLTAGHMQSLCEHLAFITDEKAAPLWKFPYMEIKVKGYRLEVKDKKGGISHHTSDIIHLKGPHPLLDGYSWREYRLLTDWMQEYMRCANALAQSKREDVRSKSQAALDNARNEFLAVLFKRSESGVKAEWKGSERAENSSLFTLHSSLFEDFSPIKWQVILFWWSGLMTQLAKKFPRVFKVQPVKKSRKGKQHTSPWDFYNSVTASIQKYIGGLSAQDVDNQPYGVTLQQLEMMAVEAEEMEKIKNKK